MGDFGITEAIALASLAVGAGSTAYQIKNANDMKDKANAAAQQQKDEQDRAIATQKSQAQAMKDQQDKATSDATNLASSNLQASQKASNALAAGGTRSDTILTSPLGITSAPTAGGSKTLLGA